MLGKIKKYYKRMISVRWDIGFVINGLDGVFSNHPIYVWVKNPYKDRWFADPFILDVDDQNIYLLVEEMRYEPHIGRIAKLIINRQSMNIEDMQIVLEEPTHLSFPNILRCKEHIYVYPENAGSGRLKLYELLDGTLQYVRDLYEGKLADAVFLQEQGHIMLMATEYPHYNGRYLGCYSKEMNGLFQKKKIYVFSDNHARMAGDFFEYKGDLYRPSQDCNRNYGGGVIIEKVSITDEDIQFQYIKKLEPPITNMKLGMHTMNIYKDVVVVDNHGYNSLLGTIVAEIVKYKKKFNVKYGRSLSRHSKA